MARDFAIEREWKSETETTSAARLLIVPEGELFALLDEKSAGRRFKRAASESEFQIVSEEVLALDARACGDSDVGDRAKARADTTKLLALEAMQSPLKLLAAGLLTSVSVVCLAADWSLIWDQRSTLYRNLQGVVPDEKWAHLMATSLQGIAAISAYHFTLRAIGPSGMRVLGIVAGGFAFLFTIALSQVAACVEVPQMLQFAAPAVSLILGGAPVSSDTACGPGQQVAAWLLTVPYISLPIVAVMAGDTAWTKFREATMSLIGQHAHRQILRELRTKKLRLGELDILIREDSAGDRQSLVAAVRAHIEATVGKRVRASTALLRDSGVAMLPREREKCEREIVDAQKFLTAEYAEEMVSRWSATRA